LIKCCVCDMMSVDRRIMINDFDPSGDSITFLGTAGARFMVSKQLAASGGMWLNLNGTEVLLDPGPGSIVQSSKKALNAENLTAILLSHRHLDHSADTNVMVEAMTNGGFHRHGWVYGPSDAFNNEPVLYGYLRKFIEGVVTLEEGKSYTVGNFSFSTPIRHQHPVETYGMLFDAAGCKVGYIADTRYFDGLASHYPADVLIINTVFTEPRPAIAHLSVPETALLVSEIKPKLAILSHFGLHVWQAKPWKIALEMTEQTGIRVVAASDGWRFDLAQVKEKKAVSGSAEI
jgi:ribonuclease BN (tRNA processing enzyme)